MNVKGRLSIWQAAMVIARRDFSAVLLSRSFIFFLLGPLFPVIVAVLAGSVGQKVQQNAAAPVIGVAMQARDADAMLAARGALDARLGDSLPAFVLVKRLAPDEPFDAPAALRGGQGSEANLAAIVTGTPAAPLLTGPQGRIDYWRGPLSLVAAEAIGQGPRSYPAVALAGTVADTSADRHEDRVHTAQVGQMLLFLLTMLLAGMVLSNLVEEKGNKIIEILAAAIPMDAVFLGKLFAMLAVSFVGIAVWGTIGGGSLLAAGRSLDELAAPAVGWPLFLALGVVYFAMAYLLLGSVFLAIGSMATTVREVQTLSMPATMLQLIVFFIASFAMTQPGSPMEIAACLFPFSSPFAMIARAAQDGAVWPHAAAIGWQAIWVAAMVKGGARMFRTRVMQSGSGGGTKQRRALFRRSAVT